MLLQKDVLKGAQENTGMFVRSLLQPFKDCYPLKKSLTTILMSFVSFNAGAATFTVLNANDSGVGSLRTAITSANASPGNIINFSLPDNSTINLITPLSGLIQPMTISTADTSGGATGTTNLTINGAGSVPAFFAYNGTPINVIGTGPAGAPSVLTLNNCRSKGGDGGVGQTSSGGGGGALGAGGGTFINGAGTGSGYTASVIFTDVNFTNNKAQGGNGGTRADPAGQYRGGGGGGLVNGQGGNADSGGASGGGGGGIGGAGGTNSNGAAGIIVGAASGGNGGGGAFVAGINAGGGGAGNAGSGGGGGVGGAAGGSPNSPGGNGGFGGGGGGTQNSTGGNGGFGGGGGGINGLGGFGAGSGGAANQNGQAGSGLGGAIFVASGGSVTIRNTTTSTNFIGNTVAVGTGGGGQAAGTAIYLQTPTEVATLDVGNGLSQTYSDNDAIAGSGRIIKTGLGSLILSTANSFTGGTTLTNGILIPNNNASLGTGTLALNAGLLAQTVGGTISLINPFTVGGVATIGGANNLTLRGAGTLNNTLNIINTSTTTLSGVIDGASPLVINTTGIVILSAANTYSGGTTLANGNLNANNSTALGTGAFAFNGGVLSQTAGGIIALENPYTVGGVGLATIGGFNSITLNGDGTLNNTLMITNTATTSLAAVNGAGSLVINSLGGTVILSGNSDVGNATINSGNFVFNAPLTTPVFTVNASGVVSQGVDYTIPDGGIITDSGIWNMNGFNIFGAAPVNGTTMVLNNHLTSTGFIGTSMVPITNLTINSPATFTANSSVNVQNMTIAYGATLALGTNLLIPTGGIINNFGNLVMNGNSILSTPSSNTILNLNNSLFATGPINNITTINTNAGTFTAGGPVSGFNTLYIANNAAMALKNTVTAGTVGLPAIISNAGTLNLNGNSLLMGSASSLTTTGLVLASGPIATIGGSPYTITVGNGGTLTVTNAINGYGDLTVTNAGVVNLNNNGKLSNSINLLNSGTLNLNGGTLVGNITGGSGIVNVNVSYTPVGSISAGTLNINNSGILNGTGAIVATNWNINNGGALIANSDITGSLALNNGATFVPLIEKSTSISGNYLQAGTLNLTILNQKKYSRLQVGGSTTINGGLLQIDLPDSGIHIQNGQVFDIITSSGPITLNSMPTIEEPKSILLDFVPSVNGNVFLLTAVRTPISKINKNPALNGVAGALDNLQNTGNVAGLSDLFKFLEIQTTEQAVQNLLAELTPDEGYNGGPLYATLHTYDLTLDKVFKRTEIARIGMNSSIYQMLGSNRSGYVAGDMSNSKTSYGPFLIGNVSKQKQANGVSGYTSTTGGFGFLIDTPVIEEFLRLGGAISYAGTGVKRNDVTGNNTSINNVTGIIYGSAEYGPLFADGAASMGFNMYRGKRHIIPLSETAISNYKSTQYGAKIRGGFSMELGPYLEISPMAFADYIHLTRGSYVETGAPGLNLAVNSKQVNANRAAIGARISDVSDPDEFFPELHVFYIHDVKLPDLTVTSRFADGGALFETNGPLPAKSGVNVGGSITASMVKDFVIMGCYDFESKKNFTSHSASMKFRWLF